MALALHRAAPAMSPLLSAHSVLDAPRRVARPFQALPLWVVLAAVATAACCALFLRVQLIDRRGAEEQKLLAIADLEARDLEHWREELERQVAAMGRNPAMAAVAEELAAPGPLGSTAGGAEPERRARALLRDVAAAERDATAWLMARDGRVLASSGGGPAASRAVIATAIRAAAERRVVVAEPLPEDGDVRVVTVVPVNGGDGVPVGSVVLESPGEAAIFRTVRRWPVPSATGEIRIVRVRGADLDVLSPPPHEADAASRGRLSRELSSLLRLGAAEGVTSIATASGNGAVPGRAPPRTALARPTARPALVPCAELAGRRVLAAVRPIGGTDWSLVATIDAAEVDQPIWAAAGEIVATATALFLATVAALVAVARRRAADLRTREAALECARELATHARVLDSTMAHELNSPLACVLANARFALEELRRGPAAQLEDAAAALEDAVDAALRTVDVVRDLQQLAHTGSPPPGIVDLRDERRVQRIRRGREPARAVADG